jgi:2-polyprenyl-3-methyl-5-hydroxy-6-metoxy-1,4-benzoquinol methylase
MALFDKSSGDYDAWYTTPVGAFVESVEAAGLFSLADNIEGAHVLDVGCGTGRLSRMLAGRGAHVTGIDISDGMLSRARASRERHGLDIDYRHMDVYDMDFEADAFDAVFSMAVFAFLPDITAALRNICRVVKPGGVAVIGTIHKGGAWAQMYESDAFAQTVFASARFRQLKDFINVDGFDIAAHCECLFVPPGRQDHDYTLENEQKEKLSGRKGGFLCVKMIKRPPQ